MPRNSFVTQVRPSQSFRPDAFRGFPWRKRDVSRLPCCMVTQARDIWKGEGDVASVKRAVVSLGCGIVSLGRAVASLGCDTTEMKGGGRVCLASPELHLAALGAQVATLFLMMREAGGPRGKSQGDELFLLLSGYCRISGTEETAYGPPRTLPSGGLRRL